MWVWILGREGQAPRARGKVGKLGRTSHSGELVVQSSARLPASAWLYAQGRGGKEGPWVGWGGLPVAKSRISSQRGSMPPVPGQGRCALCKISSFP